MQRTGTVGQFGPKYSGFGERPNKHFCGPCALQKFRSVATPELPVSYTHLFTYKSVAFVWLKKNKKADSWFYGLGFWTRGNAEICLLATKGHPKRQAANIHQFIISPIEAHSKKPDEARVKIISLMGDLPRVELFARQTPPGWAVWGNEVTPTIPDFGTHCPEVQKGV